MNLYAVGARTVKMFVLTRTSPAAEFVESVVTLHNVLHVPDLMNNGAKVTRLLSQRAAHTLNGGSKPTFISSAESSTIHFQDYYIELDAETNRNLLTMHSRIIHDDRPAEIAMTAAVRRAQKALPVALWHKRLGHISSDRLTRMQKMDLGINIKAANSTEASTICLDSPVTALVSSMST